MQKHLYNVKVFPVMILETLFDLLSASAGAIFGALFAFFLNRKRNKKMSNQLVISKQSFEKIKQENEALLKQIRDKENLILQMQVKMLSNGTSKQNKKKRKNKQ